MLGLCTRYLGARVVHTAWHWIRAMYEVRTSTDIDIEKWREKRRNVVEVQRWLEGRMGYDNNLLTDIFITESLGQATLAPTHTSVYSPMVPTDYSIRSLQGVSILFITFHDFLFITQQNLPHHSLTFLCLLSRPLIEYIRSHTHVSIPSS